MFLAYAVVAWIATCLLCLIAILLIKIWDDYRYGDEAGRGLPLGGVETEPAPAVIVPLDLYRNRDWVDHVRQWERDHPA